MIRRLTLENWRCYEAADISFEPGTTFIVAPNGIGKTSLVEAARYALTGHVDQRTSPVLKGSDQATATLNIQLPHARVLTVKRALPCAVTEPTPPPEARIGDDELSSDRLEAALRDAFGATPTFVARNAFLLDALTNLGSPELDEQLAHAFALSDMAQLAGALTDKAADLESAATILGRQFKAQEKEVAQLETELAAARGALAHADKALEEARIRLETVSQRQLAARRRQELEHQLADWETRAADIAATVSRHRPRVTPDTLDAAVPQLLVEAESALGELRQHAATLQAQIDLTQAALRDLHQAGTDCPVCLRPLDDADRSIAESRHRSTIEALEDQYSSMDLAVSGEKVDMVRSLQRQVDALGARPELPSGSGEGASDSDDAIEDLATAARTDHEAAVGARDDASRRVEALDAQLDEALRIEELRRRSVAAWRRWALTDAAATALTNSVDEALSTLVAPAAQSVRHRWNALFPDRPDVQFDLAGEIWRSVRGHRLHSDAFSGGERVAARLLLQLTILTETTTAGFCWIDEPLESLDPTRRRLVAALLSESREALGLRQLVVTTYEEELAGHLAAANEETLIRYVRASAQA